MWPPSLWLEKKNSWKRKLLSNQHLSLKVSILGSLARPQQGNHKPQTPHPNKSYLSSSGFYNVEPLVHSCKEHWKYTLDPFILEALTIAPQPTKTNLLCRVPKKIHDRLCNESLKKSRLIMGVKGSRNFGSYITYLGTWSLRVKETASKPSTSARSSARPFRISLKCHGLGFRV